MPDMTTRNLQERLDAALAWGEQQRLRANAALDALHTLSYPRADIDLLRAVANEVTCGDTAGQCGRGYNEHDTNAFVCPVEDDKDAPLGCPFIAACQLRALADALETRAIASTPETV